MQERVKETSFLEKKNGEMTVEVGEEKAKSLTKTEIKGLEEREKIKDWGI